MDRKEIIYKLKILIDEFDYEQSVLDDMINDWCENDDPSSDPDLQYEQENKVEQIWNELENFIKNEFRQNNKKFKKIK